MSYNHPVRHSDGKIDKRYEITMEYTGKENQQHVARFCGDFISGHDTHVGAALSCVFHDDERQEKMI